LFDLGDVRSLIAPLGFGFAVGFLSLIDPRFVARTAPGLPPEERQHFFESTTLKAWIGETGSLLFQLPQRLSEWFRHLARNEEKNHHVMDELYALGVPALAVKVDLAERGQLQPALDEVEKKLGPVNILVNNAGIVVLGGVLDLAP
jgi:hypothetical protein